MNTQLGDFILEHCPEPYARWDRDIFEGWLDWHCGQGFLIKAIDFDGSIAGVIMIRPILKPQDIDNRYAFDQEGSIAFIELVIATKPGVMQALVLRALKRFGRRDWIAWSRAPYFVTRFRQTARCLNLILRKELA